MDLFLEICRREFMKDYPDLKTIRGEFGLLFVLDCVIIPSTVTFFDLIKNEIQGRNGPVLKLEQRDGYVEHVGDVGTIIDKRVYDKSKHVFPLKNWEPLNMTLID